MIGVVATASWVVPRGSLLAQGERGDRDLRFAVKPQITHTQLCHRRD